MSTRNPSGWTTIHDTILSAQDTLFRLYLGLKYQESRDYREKALKAVAHVKDMSPPQTFGELCLEVGEENRTKSLMFYQDYGPPYDLKSWGDAWIRLANGAKKLRNAMYRRNTDPPVTTGPVTITNCPPDCSWHIYGVYVTPKVQPDGKTRIAGATHPEAGK